MMGLQELTMVNLKLGFKYWEGEVAEMPAEIGSLHQLRYITLHRSSAKLARRLVFPHVPFDDQIGR